MRAPLRILLALAAFAAAGCGTPSVALLPSIEPRSEVLAYFPADTPALMLVDTDPGTDQGQALAGALDRAGALGPLRALARRRGLVWPQVRPLLGNDVALGIPARGTAPLAALVAGSGDALRMLAASRVAGDRATVAGSYRGADLYAGEGHAFAVRGRVLLVSRSTADLRDALDRRTRGDAMTEADLDGRLPVRPRKGRAPIVRAVVDAGGALGASARSVPWLAAWEELGVTVRAGEDAAAVDLRLTTAGEDLFETEVPVSPGDRAPLAATARAPSVSVRDLAHVLGTAERALAVAAPLTRLRLEQARRDLRFRSKVDLGRDVVARLHGPATLVRTRRHFLLRADPSHPAPLRDALARAGRFLPSALERARLEGWTARTRGGFIEVTSDRAAKLRAGMVGDVLVVGSASRAALRALARSPLARPAGAKGALVVSAPPETLGRIASDRLGFALPWRVSGWARGSRDELRGSLTLGW